jgi:hypothetical protein
MLLIAALAVLGIGYGLWSQVLTIRGRINTGNLATAFNLAFTDDDGAVNQAPLDANDTGNCPVQAGGGSSCDPAASGSDPKQRHDKDVASCRATVSTDGLTGTVTKDRAYPGYFCTAWFQVHNSGNVPVRIAKVRIQGQEVLPNVVTPFDLTSDGQADVAVHLTGFDVCQQIDPSKVALIDVDQQILQGAPEGRQLSYTVELQFNQWNEECFPTELPVFAVTGPLLSQSQAGALGAALAIPTGGLLYENGVALFVDPVNFQAAPMQPAAGDFGRGEDGREVVAESFNFGALAEMEPISGEAALRRFQGALDKAGVVFPMFSPVAQVQHTNLEVVDPQGEMLADALLDTHLRYSFRLGGLPMIGQGAQLNFAIGPGGNPTALYVALPDVTPAEPTSIIPPSEATAACREQLGPLGDSSALSPSLVYYVPDLALGPQTVIPHWDCGGTVRVGGEQVTLLNQLLPAIDDPKYVPQVTLQVDADGLVVSAQASVQGGTPPYSFEWTATSADLSGENKAAVQYDADPKPEAGVEAFLETVNVVVTDANGVRVQASGQVELTPVIIGFLAPGASRYLAMPFLIPGRADFGIERAVSDMCANNVNRYSARMDDEATKQFHWTGLTAWERDFREGGTGLDHVYVDNVDELFYCGHGWPGGFTFESNQSDGSIVPGDVVYAWGDGDLEWLALLSCQVLAGSYGGQSWAQRWGPAFDGLHLLLGFETNAYDWSNFGKRFAEYQQGRSILFFTITLPVRSSWFQAALEEQPAGVRSVVMGVGGLNGANNYNDYFHGNGPIGPDIPKSQITYYWRQVQTTP